MFEYKGFIYGHYDSRGGTCFVVADTKDEADRRYLNDFIAVEAGNEAEFSALKDFSDVDDINDIRLRVAFLSNYLGEAILYSPVELTERCDLEDDKATVFVGGNAPPPGECWGVCPRSGEPVWYSAISMTSLFYSPDGIKRNDLSFRVRWGEDAFSFYFVPAKQPVVA